ncbi:hypothetical protein LZ30DRAFT_776490 [Colletotrichum cereale]|nr:hypothetical protein LZ30DRAFT_776490 [Colletotrichum cereale]
MGCFLFVFAIWVVARSGLSGWDGVRARKLTVANHRGGLQGFNQVSTLDLLTLSREHGAVIEVRAFFSEYKSAIMPPHPLHPRSRMTSSLFATTVVASFFVVGMPHLLPCPAPRVTYADGEIVVGEDGRRRRRKRREADPEIKDGIISFNQVSDEDTIRAHKERLKRECPVPKPGGILGEWLGFHGPSKEAESTKAER